MVPDPDRAPLCITQNFIVMAKSKSFFGLRTGLTKSLTFQVLRGEQITKDRVYRVSNPRSEAQMTQRALIPIVAAARSQLKGLVDHSFEGIAYGEPSLREFARLNLRAGALDVTSYSPNGVSNAGFANLQISNGSLNGDFRLTTTTETSTTFTTVGKYPKLTFPAATAGQSAEPIFKYLETFGKTNNVPLLKAGNQLTFLTIYEAGTAKVNSASGVIDASLSAFKIDRFMIPDTESGSTQLNDVNGIWKIKETVEANADNVVLVSNDGDEIAIRSNSAQSGSGFIINMSVTAAIGGSANCGGALILSRYVNGTWKRSTASIEISYEPRYKYTFEDWLSVYQTTATASKKYLNNGNETTGIQG